MTYAGGVWRNISRLRVKRAKEAGVRMVKMAPVGDSYALPARDVAECPVTDATVFVPSSISELAINRASIHERDANHGKKTAVYAFSTGLNWGYGSRKPKGPAQIGFDLSRLNCIKAIDTETGVAVIECGVTQAQLSEALRGSRYVTNVTGSSGGTSVVGSMLDRGIGFFRAKHEDLLGIRLVDFDGKIFEFGGPWPDNSQDNGSNAPRHYHFGPDFVGLVFQQTSLIVAEASVELIPRPECVWLVKVVFAAPNILNVIRVIRTLMRDGVVNPVAKFFLQIRPGARLSSQFFVAYVPIRGARRVSEVKVSLAAEEISRNVENVDFSIASATAEGEVSDQANVDAVMLGLYGGTPHSSESFSSVFNVPDKSVDSDAEIGVRFLHYSIYSHSDQILDLLSSVASFCSETAMSTYVTLNLCSERLLTMQVGFNFIRDEANASMASARSAQLNTLLARAGAIAFRAPIDIMSTIDTKRDLHREFLLRNLRGA